MDKSKQYQVWFEDINGGQSSVVASYDSLEGALRQMYSFYLERVSTYTMFPRLQISEPNLVQFQEFHFRNEEGSFGGIFWIVFPGASPEDRYPVDEYGYHILPSDSYPVDACLTPEEESAAIEWNRANPVAPMDWSSAMASEPAIAELFDFQPVDRFPSVGQSAIYFLGEMEEDCNPALEMTGAILVFNAKRHTVRAYRLNRRNAQSNLYWGDYRVGNDTHYAYCDGQPTGALIPTKDGILYTREGIIIWSNGVVGYLSTRGQQDKWTPIELDGYNRVYDALRANSICSDIWGCLIKFFPASSPPETHSTAYAFDQIPFAAITLEREIKFQPSSSQIVMLDAQLMYWRNRFVLADLAGDYDDCEFCSLFVFAVEALILV